MNRSLYCGSTKRVNYWWKITFKYLRLCALRVFGARVKHQKITSKDIKDARALDFFVIGK